VHFSGRRFDCIGPTEGAIFSGRKGTVNRQQQIVIIEKKLAQAKKNLKLFKRREPHTLAVENPNPLAAKLESEVSAYEFAIKELRAVRPKNGPNSG
jgi:hypothetical protein